MKNTIYAALPTTLLVGAAFSLAVLPAHAQAVIVANGSTAPTANVEISQLVGGGGNVNYQDDTNDGFNGGTSNHLPGESFTATSTFTLGSVTLESQGAVPTSGGGTGSISAGDQLELYIYSSSGIYGNLTTELGEYTVSAGSALAANPDQFFTFSDLNTSGAPITFTSGDSYAFYVTETAGTQDGLELENAGAAGASVNAPATGASANTGLIDYVGADPSSEGSPSLGGYNAGYDRVFEIGAAAPAVSATPEPSQIGMIALMGLGLGGLLLKARKVRTA